MAWEECFPALLSHYGDVNSPEDSKMESRVSTAGNQGGRGARPWLAAGVGLGSPSALTCNPGGSVRGAGGG